MVLTKTRVIDGRDHLLGRLASIVAKELLAGQSIVIVRCDEICISGSCTFRSRAFAVPRCAGLSNLMTNTFVLLFLVTRNRIKYAQFRAKHMNTNPARGPFHQKSPALMVWRTIRGMIHQKSARGQAAMTRLSTFEGIPAPYDKQKRVVIPAALRVMRLKAQRDYTIMGDLAHSVGWKHKDLLQKLESKRKEDANEFYEKKKQAASARRKAVEAAAGELAKVNEVLATAGY